jgi:hypothetical protein
MGKTDEIVAGNKREWNYFFQFLFFNIWINNNIVSKKDKTFLSKRSMGASMRVSTQIPQSLKHATFTPKPSNPFRA